MRPPLRPYATFATSVSAALRVHLPRIVLLFFLIHGIATWINNGGRLPRDQVADYSHFSGAAEKVTAGAIEAPALFDRLTLEAPATTASQRTRPPAKPSSAPRCDALQTPDNNFSPTAHYLRGTWAPADLDDDERSGVPPERYVPFAAVDGPDACPHFAKSGQPQCTWTAELPYHKWRPEASECSSQPAYYLNDRVQLQRFMRFLRHNMFVIVGDSLSSQASYVLYCQLRAAGCYGNAEPNEKVFFFYRPTMYALNFSTPITQGKEMLHQCVPNVMERLDAGEFTLGKPVTQLYETPTIELLRSRDRGGGPFSGNLQDSNEDVDRDVPRGATVIVINIGQWYNNYKLELCNISDDDIELLYEAALRRIFSDVSRAQKVRKERANALGVPDRLVVVFRTILPSGCALTQEQQAKEKSKPAFMWNLMPARNKLAQRLAKEYGIMILDPEAGLAARNHGKMKYHSAEKSGDCVHYCFGRGSPLNVLAEAMLRMLDLDLGLLPPPTTQY